MLYWCDFIPLMGLSCVSFRSRLDQIQAFIRTFVLVMLFYNCVLLENHLSAWLYV